jgi:hypothetical protein
LVNLATSQVTGTAVGATCVFVYDDAFAPHTCTTP